MRVSFLPGWRWLAVAGLLGLQTACAGGLEVLVQAKARSAGTGQAAGVCRRAKVDGEVKAGEEFVRELGGGLEAMLEPLASGWILRVVPASGPRGEHDYAELATPPYRSVSPLLVSTDFSFRAQDAVGWNPRRFHFAASAAEFAGLSAAYRAYARTAVPSAKAEAELSEAAARMHEGELQITDARLVPGTANQAGTAAMVASHFSTTAHTIEQPADGKGSALGRVTWIRFRMLFDLPRGFPVGKGLDVEGRSCP